MAERLVEKHREEIVSAAERLWVSGAVTLEPPAEPAEERSSNMSISPYRDVTTPGPAGQAAAVSTTLAARGASRKAKARTDFIARA